MNIAVLMMMGNMEPSLRNAEAFKTYIVDESNQLSLNNNYDFIFYYGNNTDITSSYHIKDNIYEIHTNTPDDIHSTFEKTVEAFKNIVEKDKYDWIIRVNISTFINIRLIDKLINSLNSDKIYCNALNAILHSEEYMNLLYPRGDFYIMSINTVKDILKVSDKFYIDYKSNKDYEKAFLCTEHVDDVLMGICLYEAYGIRYCDRLESIYYDFYPELSTENHKFHYYTISVRLKTTPPNMYSGYSWADNDYRLEDPKKFKICSDIFKKVQDYTETDIKSFIIPKNKGRKVACIADISGLEVEDIQKYLYRKKEV